MSHIESWIHLVWSTKHRYPYLQDEIRHKVFYHIQVNCIAKGIQLDRVNGYLDHVHCLIRMDAVTSIMQYAKLIKGESSIWINDNLLTETRFSWQREYYAKSVSPDHLPRVRSYIDRQEEHHRRNDLASELIDLGLEPTPAPHLSAGQGWK